MTSAIAHYRELVERLGVEAKHRRGWKTAAAKRLGVSPSFITKVLRGDIHDIGGDVMGRAVSALGVSADVFFGDQKTVGDISTERYMALVQHLGTEAGFARGWMRKAADRLGVSASYLSRVHSGLVKGVGVDVIERAAKACDLSVSWFTAADARPVPAKEPPVAVDGEFAAMRALAGLDGATRARVLRWATDRWGVE